MPYDLGATARLTAECRSPAGTLVTATAAVVTVTLPDGTTATPTVSETDTGSYRADYVTTQAGRHTVRWVFTGPAHAYTDIVDVREAALTWVFSLADAKNHIKLATASQDEEVRRWIGATTKCVEWFVGPVAPRTVTEDHNVRQAEALALRKIPALSLTTVAAVLDGGTSYEVGGLDLDGADGIVRRKNGGLFYGPLRVTYRAGRLIVTENISSAAELIFQHLWRTRLGPGRTQQRGGGDDYDVTEPIPGLGYAIPNRAMQLLSPDQLPPGTA
ncbi:hypothetical protein [Streptomyces graminilatus]|uniref:hypothetical protein n=1 Tax=Streptomyces graminilatus TaxID=1464070 RepID=UPI0006E381DE|nr:hypothetical protein [Streptomyces graminilatus]